MLWHSAPTSLNNDLLDDGVILETCNKAINVAVDTFFTFHFTHKKPRLFFLGAQRLGLMRCTDGWDRWSQREVTGWNLGGRPDVEPENEDDGRDIEPENF